MVQRGAKESGSRHTREEGRVLDCRTQQPLCRVAVAQFHCHLARAFLKPVAQSFTVTIHVPSRPPGPPLLDSMLSKGTAPPPDVPSPDGSAVCGTSGTATCVFGTTVTNSSVRTPFPSLRNPRTFHSHVSCIKFVSMSRQRVKGENKCHRSTCSPHTRCGACGDRRTSVYRFTAESSLCWGGGAVVLCRVA